MTTLDTSNLKRLNVSGLRRITPAAQDEMPGVFEAAQQGVSASIAQLSQTAETLAGQQPRQDEAPNAAAAPFAWSDLASPLKQGAPKLSYRLGESAPVIAGGVATGIVGGAAGTAIAGPPGAAVGSLAGGAVGASAITAAQSLGPIYAAEIKMTPNDPDGSFDRAMKKAGTAGLFSGAAWALFPLRFFHGPVKNLLLQALGVQPGVSMAHKAISNVQEGQPVGEGMGQAYAEGAVMTAVPALGHRLITTGLKSLGKARTAPPAADQAQPGAPPQEAARAPTAAAGDAARGAAAAAPESVLTPDQSMRVPVTTEIVDLSTLKQAAGDLQPRDRSRAEGEAAAHDRAANLNPDMLMPDPISDSGAPIVAGDGTIVSGNGRVLSLAKVYGNPALKHHADAYRAAIGDSGKDMAFPVLIRRLPGDMTTADMTRFADLSNRSRIAAMSATEIAGKDARGLGLEDMALYKGGDIETPANALFLRTFLAKAVSPSELGALSKGGRLTKPGEDRINAALLASAYDKPDMLSRMLESTDDNIRNLSAAMRDAAPGFIKLKANIAAQETPSHFDITPHLGDAANALSDLRAQRVPMRDYFAQADAFGRDPAVERLLRIFYNPATGEARPRKQISDWLTLYADEAAKKRTTGLFEDRSTAEDVIRYASGELGFEAPQARPGGLGPHGPGEPTDFRQGQGLAPPPPLTAEAPQPQIPPRPPQGPPGPALPPNLFPPPVGGRAPPPRIPRLPLPPTSSPPWWRQIGALTRWKTDVIEFWQDSMVRVRYLQESVSGGRPLPDYADPYLKATLYYGKTDTIMRAGQEQAQKIVGDAAALAKTMNVPLEDARKIVNDYLIAQHAPERNARHGDGAAGITTSDATRMLLALRAHPQAKAIAAIADQALTLNRSALTMLKDAGVISGQIYTTLQSAYRRHVPLNRIFAADEDVGGGLSGRGFDVYSSGLKRAKGSDREVADLLGNILFNYKQAALRSQKNLVDLATLNFVRLHQGQLAGLMRIKPQRVIGKRADGAPIFAQEGDPRVLHLYENGKPVLIETKDVRLAAALRSINRDKLPVFLRAWAGFTRLYAGLQTRFNYEFAAPNKARDLQEMLVYMAANKQIGLKSAAKAVLRDPISIKAVTDSIRGRDTPGARLYKEMMVMGGTTGGLGLSTRARVDIDIARLERLATSAPARYFDRLVEYVDHWNTIFEDSTRLSVYKTALEQGLSKERAAFLAKEGTVNFNRMGTAGPVVNGLWMFSNASIQGSAKMLRSLRNPKVATGTAIVIGSAVTAVYQWNDSVDPDWRDKVTKWDRLNSLPFVLPSEDDTFRYHVVPVSWGIKPLYVMAAYTHDLIEGKANDVSGALNDIMTAIVDAYNPVGGTDVFQAITPTIFDAPLDLARNRAWYGGPIKPDYDKSLPRDLQYFMKMKETQSGRTAISISEALHDYSGVMLSPADLNYAFEQYIGGAGRSVRKLGDTLIGAATGQLPPADEFPIISRFYRQREADETGRGTQGEMDKIRGVQSEQARERFIIKNKADDAVRAIENLPPEQKRAAFQRLMQEDRAVAGKAAEKLTEKQRGTTFIDRSIIALGVGNGERARYLVERLDGISQVERNRLISDWRKKGVITAEVLRQMRVLQAGRSFTPKPPKVRIPDFTPSP